MLRTCPECQMPLEGMQEVCPSCHCRVTGGGSAAPPVGRFGTMVESVEEIQRAVRGANPAVGQKTAPPRPASVAGTPPKRPVPPPIKLSKTGPAISASNVAAPKPASAEESGNVLAFRPIGRPPVFRLCVLDDGQSEEGEWIRVRSERFVIGRSEGDLVIPHDDAMSGRHAEIVRAIERGQHRFTLRDLRSTNGTFVRVTRAALRQDQEMLIGGRRYRFESAGAAAAETEEAPAIEGTRAWRAVSVSDLQKMTASLVELTPAGDGRRILLTKEDVALGTDSGQCEVVLENDPFVSPRHARIYRDDRQRWMIENLKSLNGLWLRATDVPLSASSEFQLGEQRFLVRLD